MTRKIECVVACPSLPLARTSALGDTRRAIERVFRIANSFEEADEDIAALSFEERISGVERLRRAHFGKVDLNQERTEFLSALIAHRARFVLVAGRAVAGHAEPRFTEDLDVLVEPSLPKAKRLRAALIAFGFGEATPAPSVLATPDTVFMLGRKPTRIDILTGIDGVSFAEVWKGRVEAELTASPLYVIGREHLLANKRAAGRPKDLLDVAALQRLETANATPKTKAPATPRRKIAAALTKRRR